MAEWKPSSEEFLILVWQEIEGGQEEEAETEISTSTWIFRTEQDARAFILDEVMDRVRLNADELPPAIVREMTEAASKGDQEMVLGMWLEVAERFFEQPEMVNLLKSNIMSRQ